VLVSERASSICAHRRQKRKSKMNETRIIDQDTLYEVIPTHLNNYFRQTAVACLRRSVYTTSPKHVAYQHLFKPASKGILAEAVVLQGMFQRFISQVLAFTVSLSLCEALAELHQHAVRTYTVHNPMSA
jgi:hypothetical protein